MPRRSRIYFNRALSIDFVNQLCQDLGATYIGCASNGKLVAVIVESEGSIDPEPLQEYAKDGFVGTGPDKREYQFKPDNR